MPILRNVSASNLKSDAIFEAICDRVKKEPAKAKAVNAVFLYNITKDGKQVKQWSTLYKIWLSAIFNYACFSDGFKKCKNL